MFTGDLTLCLTPINISNKCLVGGVDLPDTDLSITRKSESTKLKIKMLLAEWIHTMRIRSSPLNGLSLKSK